MSDEIRESFKKYRANLAALLVQGEDWARAFKLADEILSFACFESGWKAATESLAIELPAVGPEPAAPEDAIDDSYLDAYHAAKRMRAECLKAIESAGVKVKP